MTTRNRSLLNLLLLLGIILFVNILGNVFFTGIDLTEDKRFTLAAPTIDLAREMEDVVYIQLLLDGDFPAGFKRLQRATLELLDDLRSENGYIEYHLDEPGANATSEQEKFDIRKTLAERGITPVNLRLVDTDGTQQKFIYPYAIVNYRGRSEIVNLLEQELPGLGQDVILNNSVSLLEYKFAQAFQKLTRPTKPVIAYLRGHGELADEQLRDLTKTLRPSYDVGSFYLDSTYLIPKGIDMMIVAKPRTAFSDKDKFKLDQYIMNGGRVLWLIDRIDVNMDSLRNKSYYVPTDYPLNIEDLLYKYGARIEPNLLADRQCSKIPQVIGQAGGQAQVEFFDWYYHPVFLSNPETAHPIAKNLGPINMYFPSSVDTIKTKTPVQKTVILQSSQYSKLQYLPFRLSFEILKYQPQASWFNQPEQPVALLLEGTFPSNYENRVDDSMRDLLDEIESPYRATSVPNKMIIIADGDIAKNELTSDGGYLPLGYNRYAKTQFANKEFLTNAIDYLLDESGVIEARNKEVKLRLLDQVRSRNERTYWQLFNLLVPILFLVIFGLTWHYVRKKRFS